MIYKIKNTKTGQYLGTRNNFGKTGREWKREYAVIDAVIELLRVQSAVTVNDLEIEVFETIKVENISPAKAIANRKEQKSKIKDDKDKRILEAQHKNLIRQQENIQKQLNKFK